MFLFTCRKTIRSWLSRTFTKAQHGAHEKMAQFTDNRPPPKNKTTHKHDVQPLLVSHVSLLCRIFSCRCVSFPCRFFSFVRLSFVSYFACGFLLHLGRDGIGVIAVPSGGACASFARVCVCVFIYWHRNYSKSRLTYRPGTSSQRHDAA